MLEVSEKDVVVRLKLVIPELIKEKKKEKKERKGNRKV